ncbi:MAG: sulfite reductase subunit alpha [Gammaproteobacteria bacterium]|nr:sulfite reductase subunit alpha [Gammaproteobacteria bacterium]
MTSQNIKSVCPYCGVGCGIILHVEDGQVVKVSGDKDHPTNFGRLCTKGSSSHLALRKSGRLENAFIRSNRNLEAVQLPMANAIKETATRLRHILDEHGPDALSFYVSGQMSIESQYLINKLAKGFVGTNNIESNSRLCMASAGSGYKLSLGADGPPGSYQDFDHTDLFFVIGSNMADCHPILFLRMMDRVKAGAKLIVVDPRKNATADKASLFMQIKPGTDLALLNGLLHLLHKNGHTDAEFIEDFTGGWNDLPAFLEDYTPEKVSEITGIPEADIRQAAQMIGEAPEFISCWTMGLNQSTHGTWNTNAICNLHLATGKICRLGSGPFSLTGQPNAMGGREMGYMGAGLPGQRSVLVDDDRAFIENLWKIPAGTLTTKLGTGTVDMFERMSAGEIKTCWVICTNPVATVPNRQNVINGLEAAELVISQDAFFDTETNRYADILLPGALWAEAEGVMINSERNMTLMQKAIDPPEAALPDWQIIALVACEMGFSEAFNYASAAEVFAEISAATNLKTGYDLRGASHARLKETPLQWPCSPESIENRNPIRYINDGISQTSYEKPDGKRPRLIFPTPQKKGVFFARPHIDPNEMPDAGFPVVLNTGRLQHQWHTMTKTGKIPMLNKLNPSTFVEIHPEDAAALDIKDQDTVEVRSRRGFAHLPAVVTPRVRAGNCFVPMHWNDNFGKNLCINAVTNDAIDPISQQPEFKFCAVQLKKVAAPHNTKAAPEKNISASTTNSHVTEELDMSHIDALNELLGLPLLEAPKLDDAEKTYMAGFISGLRTTEGRQAGGIPTIPTAAPLSSHTKLWLDGVLAGLFSRSAVAPLALSHELDSSRVMRMRPKVALLWASQTGNIESLSERYATKLMEAGFEIRLSCMSDYQTSNLDKAQYVLLMSSTFGDGDPPDNGQTFWSALKADNAPKLNGVRYAVIAFGDANYDQFCGHGKNLDKRMAELGAISLTDRVDCDTEYQPAADQWLERAIARIKEEDELIHATPAGEITAVPARTLPTKANPAPARLIKNLRLNTAGATKDTRYFAFDVGDSGLEYEAGDSLGVWPSNCPDLVNEVIELVGLKPNVMVNVAKVGDVELVEALTKHFEIARPSHDALTFIATHTQSDELSQLLKEDRKEDLKTWLWNRQLVDVLHQFPVKMTASELLNVLKRMQPRLYSIASSPKAHPGEVHLTVSAVRYEHEQRLRKGVSSTFLAERADTITIPVFVQQSAHFRPPHQGNTPMIMVGPGTGIAPFRGFLHERRARGDKGRNWLFFGDQYSATDFYYREELEEMQKDGLLTHLDLAFSRDQPEKIYVQDRMREHGAELWAWLEEGAHFYVCGDASKMAKDVDATLKSIIAKHGGLSEDKAQEYINRLSKEKRYVRDVY